MTRIGITGRIAKGATQQPWLFLIGWLLLLGMAAYLATGLGGVIDDSAGLEVETESGRADTLIEAHFADGQPASEILIVESNGDPYGSAAFDAVLATLGERLATVDTVETVVSPLDGVPGLVSGDSALITFTLIPETDDLDPIEPVLEMLDGAEPDGFDLTLIGDASIGAEFDRLAEETLIRGEGIGLAIALLIMVGVFGALVAAGIPIVLSICAIIVGVAITVLAGEVFSISSLVLNMITMIGLAVGVDYALFIVHRFREERSAGLGVADAVVRAGDTAGRAIVFSGVTVMTALSGLLLVPDGTIRGVGIGAICAVIGAVLVAVTLLPALLMVLGDRIEWGRVPFLRRSRGRFWDRTTAVVTRHPMVSALAAGGLLIALAIPYFSINLGSNFVASLPEDSPAAHGLEVLNTEFGAGTTSTKIVVDAEDLAGGVPTDRIDALQAELVASGVYGTPVVSTTPLGDVALIEVADLTDYSTEAGREALDGLRGLIIPEVFDGSGAAVVVTGDAADTADFVAVIDSRTLVVVATVLSVSFVLLMLAFRSVVVPIKAIIMNLLSVGAAYGLLVLVFQRGFGADMLGLQTSDVIESWIPLFLFTVLFGLSMDYHIFLLSRIKEHHDLHGDNVASVAFGLRSTGALITGAALIMVAVFGGFASGDLAMLQQLGFGLAVAVILDATVVRSVLVPASMTLLGERNWYLPAWLEWLPRVSIEGRPEPGRLPVKV